MFFSLITILLAASRTGLVSGTVTDATSKLPISGASVVLIGTSSGTATTENGRFVLGPVNAGKWRLVASHVAFASETIEIEVPGHGVARVEFQLQPQVIALPGVEVASRRTRADRAVTVRELSAEQLARNAGGFVADPVRTLSFLPGVGHSTRGEWSGAYAVRGGDPDESAVFFGSTELLWPYHLLGFSSVINSDLVERISFYPSAFPARYGGALSSIVVVQPRRGKQSQGFWAYDPMNAKAAYLAELGDIRFLGSYRRTYYYVLFGPLGGGRNNRPSFSDFTGQFELSLGDWNRLRATVVNGTDQIVSDLHGETREVGEWFEYRFSQPVTVRRNESAMLPFLQQEIEARKLLIYSDPSSQHPLNAAELVNTSGKTLDGGPVTVFDAGAYAGEALMETLKTGDKRLISYGVDLGTRVSTAFDSDRARVREVHVRRGILTARSAIRETRTYTARNVDQKGKTLIIEHPVRQGYDLVEPQPREKTARAYRFELELAGGRTEKLPVVEERQLEETYALVNQTPDFLATFIQNKQISEQARRALERVAAQQRRIAEADSEIGRLEKEIQELTADQQRIRENIASLNRVSGQQEQVQKYAARLAEQEKRLAGLRDGLSEARSGRDALRQELNRMIEAMEF